jgi:hypothetical protein
MATCILETLELNELYIRKEHLLLQLILVDKQIKKRLEYPNNNEKNNKNNIITSNDTMNLSEHSRDKELISEVLTKDIMSKKITIRIKKK